MRCLTRSRWPLLWLVTIISLLLSGPAAAEKMKGGIGLAVVPTAEGELVVLKVVADTPAYSAGMRPGDLIVQVDGFPLHGSDFTEVTSRYLWGEADTPVTLKYLRPGEKGVHTVTLQRIPFDPRGETGAGKLPVSPGK